MKNQEFLTEENYERGKKKIKRIAIVVLLLTLMIGGSFIGYGIYKQAKVDEKYSETNKTNEKEAKEKEIAQLREQLNTEKENLMTKKSEIEAKLKPIQDEIKKLEREPFKGFDSAYYERQDKIEELEKSMESDQKLIEVINDALNEGFNHCAFDETKNHNITSKYCSIKNQIRDKDSIIGDMDDTFSDLDKSMEKNDSIPFYMFGGFIILVGCMISGGIYMITKRREMLAFGAQQVMPVMQEGMEKVAPTIAKVTDTVAPSIGNVAKEISKGIKEGFKDDKE